MTSFVYFAGEQCLKTSESFIPRKSSAAPRYGAEINGKMRLSTLSIELVIDGGELLRDAVTSVELRTSNAKWGENLLQATYIITATAIYL